jgi:hypothetical protein
LEEYRIESRIGHNEKFKGALPEIPFFPGNIQRVGQYPRVGGLIAFPAIMVQGYPRVGGLIAFPAIMIQGLLLAPSIEPHM